MRRIMSAETLKDYLASAYTPVMLCRAHADRFNLTSEDILDAEWQIHLHIVELEDLRVQIRSNAGDIRVDNMLSIATARA